MKEDVLATMARELAEMLRRDATIDWQFKENVRAKLRLKIKTLLKRQLLEPVKWEQGTLDLIKGGHAQYVEPGPGKQLKAMMRRIDQDAWNKTITLEK